MIQIAKHKPPVDQESPATKQWGYDFGVDGLLSAEEASEFLGKMSRASLYRLVEQGKIRKGRVNKIYFCKRSVIEFAKSIEQ
jgi:hypothetical protein